MKTFKELLSDLNEAAGVDRIEETMAEAAAIPIQKVTDGVASVLGPKGVVRFITQLKPKTDKTTTWEKTNSALMAMGTKQQHIVKIAHAIKPAMYK